MTTSSNRFDPWGPISAALYGLNDSDFVQDAIANTGVDVHWHPFTAAEKYSHGTRIRALRQDIAAAYARLAQEERGLFAQVVVKAMLGRRDGPEIRARLSEALADIGWVISESDVLQTRDVLIGEQFFPPNSEFDAYVTIRDILARAKRELTIVDAYIGSSMLVTIRSLTSQPPVVRLLTVERNLKHDFSLEVAAFRRQIASIHLEIRGAPDFHDRFIGVDSTEFYHIGASIKDAGKRAFMISRIEDPANINAIRASIDYSWAHARLLAL